MHHKVVLFILSVLLLNACSGLSFSREPTPACFKKSSASTETTRPNIIFILSDDQEAASLAYMPLVQRLLVEQGVALDNFFINVPQCCPSRSTILLGQYSHNTGILRNGGEQGGFKTFFRLGKENITIAVGLQSVGYRTVLMGKYLNSYPGAVKKRTYVPQGWDEWYVPVTGNPYSNYNYRLNMNGELVSYQKESEDYLTDVIAGLAVDFIRRRAGPGQPFFVYVAPYAPHGPATPAQRHGALFSDLTLSHAGSYNEADVSDKPAYIRDLPLLPPEYDKGFNGLYVSKLRSLQAIDEMVEQIVAVLEQTGELENTYIIYTSDNGFHIGEHRQLDGKLTPYEEDIRVPFVVRGPGVPAGVVRSEIAGNVDMAATFAELGGLDLSQNCDGRSLKPLFLGETLALSDWRQAYLIQYWAGQSWVGEVAAEDPFVDGTLEPPDGATQPDGAAQSAGEDALPNIPAYKALRIRDLVYIEYDTGEKELYNLRADPYQLENLAAKADAALLEQLSGWLARLSVCKGPSCRQAEQPPSGFTFPWP